MEPKVTQILSDEHKTVLERLDRLEAALDGPTGEVDIAAVESVLAFFQTGLPIHRRKEEEVLFPLLADKIGRGEGPVACMLHEHEIERGLVKQLRDAVERAKRGAETGGQTRAAGRAILDLLRNHIAKEDEILFPLAEQVLDEAEKRRVREGFAGIGACCAACAGRGPTRLDT